MKVLFTHQFAKQIQKVKDKAVAANIQAAIVNVKVASSLSEIGHLKKLKGTKYAYRIRIGEYRIGIHCSADIVEFACFMHRKDIYKFFP